MLLAFFITIDNGINLHTGQEDIHVLSEEHKGQDKFLS